MFPAVNTQKWETGGKTVSFEHPTLGWLPDTKTTVNAILVTTQRTATVTTTAHRLNRDGKKRFLLPTAMTRLLVRNQSLPFGEYIRINSYGKGLREVFRGYVNELGGTNLINVLYDNSDIRTRLRETSRERLRSDMSGVKVNLAQAFAERKQVDQMIGKTATRLFYGLRDLKHGDFAGAVRHLGFTKKHARSLRRRKKLPPGRDRFSPKETSSMWLEGQYGWIPLLSDARDAAEALAAHDMDEGVQRYRFNTTGSARHKYTPVEPIHTNAPGGGIIKTSYNGKYDLSVRTRADFCLSENAELIKAFADTGILDPALLAWELVPFSFVVDWFLPIGNYLENLNWSQGFDFLGASESFRVRSNLTRIDEVIKSGKSTTAYAPVSGRTVKMYRANSVERQVLTLPDLGPSLRLKSPFSPIHAANGIALLAQFFKAKW